MTKKKLKIKETTYVMQKNAGSEWYEELYNWLFHSSFSNEIDTEDNIKDNNL